jgi:ferric-dicitrate binding protein FerR (iron transport regulator)
VKVDDRVRIGSTLSTGQKSLATLTLSNGATLRLGSESELEVEEFGQAPVAGSPKLAELKEEPSLSRTRLRLLRGDVAVDVKPLKVSRGSSFMLTTAAGTVRLGEGALHARVRMSDLGLGVCTIELQRGAAEFEVLGGTFKPVPLGQKLVFALEVNKSTGVVQVGEMPKETPNAKK